MSKARDLSDFISVATVDATEIADLAITHAKLHNDMNLSSKTVTLPSAITNTITNKLPLAGGTLTGNLTVPQIEVGDGSAGGTSEILFSDNVSSRGKIKYNHGSNPEVLTLETTGTVGVSIDNAQNVSIPNGNLTLGDNNKAIFGAGSDLQIYHTGTDSVIQEAVSTRRFLIAGDEIAVRTADLSEDMAKFNANGAVELLHNNVKKFETTATGVAITGTTTSSGQVKVTGSSASTVAFSVGDTNTGFYNTGSNAIGLSINGANKLHVNNSGFVGIGIAAPSSKLEVNGGADGSVVFSGRSDGGNGNNTRFNLIAYANGGGANYGGGLKIQTRSATNVFADAITVQSNGNVGIGTTTPTGGLEIQGTHIGVNGVDDDYFKALKLSIPDNTEWGGQAQFSVGRWQNGGNHARSSLVIALGGAAQNSDSDADTRVMTLISSGRVIFSPTGTPDGQGVTTYANGANGHYVACTGTSNYWITNYGQSASTGALSTFYNNSTYCGGITITSTNVTNYNSASDYRLKENVATMTGATERLKRLNPVTFDWINSGEASEGFIAHEVGAVVPISTTGDKDEIYDQVGSDDNPNINVGDPKYQSVDPAKLVPLLVKTIQELEARITALETV